MTVGHIINNGISSQNLTLSDVAKKAGFVSARVLELISQDICVLPMNMLVPLADAINVDPATIYRQAMQQYRPKEWTILELTLACHEITAQNLKHVETLRKLGGNVDALSEVDYERYKFARSHLNKK